VKCVSCGSENGPGARFCALCGQALSLSTGVGPAGLQPNQIPYPNARQVEFWSDMTRRKTEKFLSSLFGGISWLMVSLGTFMVAFGYLGLIDSAYSYYGDSSDSLHMIGFGIIAYAVAAIFVAMNRFTKSR